MKPFTGIRKKFRNSSPVRVIAVSFIVLILTGAALLTLPVSSADGTFTNPVNALFTATSASCVTGLTTYDTMTHWSIFGQIVILLMIQTGGLGMVTFVTFFTMVFKRKMGFRDLSLAREATGSNSSAGAQKLLRTVIGVTLGSELIGALLMSLRFCPEMGLKEVFYVSVFLAVSAYCNASLDILGPEAGSMSAFNGDPLVSGVICALVIISGLGFIVYTDIFSSAKTKKRLMTHSKIVLIGTAVLLAAGTLIFLCIEWDNTLKDMTFFEKLNASFMQSVFARTAGFYSVPLGDIQSYTKILYMAIMIIGGAPGSTAGGIKITSVAILLYTIIGVMKGKEDTEIDGKKVSHSAVYSALTITVCGFAAVFLTMTVILFTNSGISTVDAAFEAVSAFATVGTTCGITPELSVISKLMVIFTMFIGRVGPISLSLAVTKKRGLVETNEILPEAKILVG